MHQRAEKRRRQRIEISPRLAHHMLGDELRRVFIHVDEAMQLAQNVVRNVPAGARLAMQEDRNLGVLVTNLLDEGAQLGNGFLFLVGQLLIIHRQDEGRGAALLLGERGQIAIAGDAEHFHAFLFDGRRQRADAQAGSVLGTEVLVDDDDGKVKAHGSSLVLGPAIRFWAA